MADLLYPAMVSGEISPDLYGRTDKEIYYKGLKKARNVYILPEGGVRLKEGQQFITTTPSNAQARMFAFNFNDLQKYLLVFSSGALRIYKDDVLQATVTSSPISTLTDTIISEMNVTQKADYFFVTHPDIPPIQITRSSHTSWTAANVTFTNLPVYPFSGVTTSQPAASLTFGAVSGKYVSVTAAAAIFDTGYVGQYISLKNGGLAKVVEYSSTTVVFASIEINLNATTASANFWTYEQGYESVWSVTRGYPRACRFHQNRFWLVGAKSLPNGYWASVVGEFFNMDIGKGADDDGIEGYIDDEELNGIRDIRSGSKNLVLFTTGKNFYLPSDTGRPITPSTAFAVPIAEDGVGTAGSTFIDGNILYANKNGTMIKSIRFDFTQDAPNSEEVSRLSAHLIRNPQRVGVRLATEDNPVNYSYWVNEDGTIAVFNFLQQQQLAAWSLFEEDGAVYEDFCTVGEESYVIVRRYLNGGVKRYIEKLNPNYIMNAAEIATSGSATTAWTGFDHLDATECFVRGDDYTLNRNTPSSGAITTEVAVSQVEIGLYHPFRVETLALDSVQYPNFKYTGSWKRAVAVWPLLKDTRDFVVEVNGVAYRPHLFYYPDSSLDAPVQYFTGWKLIPVSGKGRDVTIAFTNDYPLEFKLQSVKVRVK